jgi:hypothetical protein
MGSTLAGQVSSNLKRGNQKWGGRSSPGWKAYGERKEAWIRAHPNATGREIEKAARAIAKDLGL